MNRLSEKYKNEIIPKLKEKYNYTSVMQVPKLEKIVINIGVGDATINDKFLEAACNELELITSPLVHKDSLCRSISIDWNGLMVTLTGFCLKSLPL